VSRVDFQGGGYHNKVFPGVPGSVLRIARESGEVEVCSFRDWGEPGWIDLAGSV